MDLFDVLACHLYRSDIEIPPALRPLMLFRVPLQVEKTIRSNQQPRQRHASSSLPPEAYAKPDKPKKRFEGSASHTEYLLTSRLLHDPPRNSKTRCIDHCPSSRTSVVSPLLPGTSTVPLIWTCRRDCWTSRPRSLGARLTWKCMDR